MAHNFLLSAHLGTGGDKVNLLTSCPSASMSEGIKFNRNMVITSFSTRSINSSATHIIHKLGKKLSHLLVLLLPLSNYSLHGFF